MCGPPDILNSHNRPLASRRHNLSFLDEAYSILAHDHAFFLRGWFRSRCNCAKRIFVHPAFTICHASAASAG